MLRITAKQQLMREIVDILSVLTDEAKLVWGEKGLGVSVVDGSHVALLSATIADECFEMYEVEPVEIGLELGKMRDLLTLAGPSDLVEMDYDERKAAIRKHRNDPDNESCFGAPDPETEREKAQRMSSYQLAKRVYNGFTQRVYTTGLPPSSRQ